MVEDCHRALRGWAPVFGDKQHVAEFGLSRLLDPFSFQYPEWPNNRMIKHSQHLARGAAKSTVWVHGPCRVPCLRPHGPVLGGAAGAAAQRRGGAGRAQADDRTVLHGRSRIFLWGSSFGRKCCPQKTRPNRSVSLLGCSTFNENLGNQSKVAQTGFKQPQSNSGFRFQFYRPQQPQERFPKEFHFCNKGLRFALLAFRRSFPKRKPNNAAITAEQHTAWQVGGTFLGVGLTS